LLAGFGILLPFAGSPAPRVNSFIPTLTAILVVNYGITAALFFIQFSIARSSALLALASGYLFTALMVIPYAVSFPDAFREGALFGNGLQNTAWLYVLWHVGLPVAVLFYALAKDAVRGSYMLQVSVRSAIGWTAVSVIGLVCALTWVATAGGRFLPQLYSDRQLILTAQLVFFTVVFLSVAALAVLWSRHSSMLDQWLMVVLCAWILELTMIGLLLAPRFSLGFYAIRVFSLITATVVLVVLISETARLYLRLAQSNMMLKRERDGKLLSLEVMAASISHEVRQPLGAIATNGGVGLLLLKQTPPDCEHVRVVLNSIVKDSHRANEVFESIGSLFSGTIQRQQATDLNEVILGALSDLSEELAGHGVLVQHELASALPFVFAHRGQMHEVLVNLVQNSIDAMEATKAGSRVLRVRTQFDCPDKVIVMVQDTGSGISSESLDSVFDTFVTTKPHGMGLGLAICRMIVERHGGQLSACSDQKTGNGALFQFTLPIEATLTTAS
jgi:signal transduction histidine kinase